jgi:hypothetical protein
MKAPAHGAGGLMWGVAVLSKDGQTLLQRLLAEDEKTVQAICTAARSRDLTSQIWISPPAGAVYAWDDKPLGLSDACAPGEPTDPRDPRPDHEMVGRAAIFRDHNCSRCRSGERPCVNGNPNQCGWPHARND